MAPHIPPYLPWPPVTFMTSFHISCHLALSSLAFPAFLLFWEYTRHPPVSRLYPVPLSLLRDMTLALTSFCSLLKCHIFCGSLATPSFKTAPIYPTTFHITLLLCFSPFSHYHLSFLFFFYCFSIVYRLLLLIRTWAQWGKEFFS